MSGRPWEATKPTNLWAHGSYAVPALLVSLHAPLRGVFVATSRARPDDTGVMVPDVEDDVRSVCSMRTWWACLSLTDVPLAAFAACTDANLLPRVRVVHERVRAHVVGEVGPYRRDLGATPWDRARNGQDLSHPRKV
jgi:hypothetical protein